MMRFLLASFLTLMSQAASRCQEAGADSQKVYQVPEIVVTATRGQIPLKDSPSQMDVIDGSALTTLAGSTVADALLRETSMFLRQYGASGALRTLSLRGGASEHTLILINGNRINNFQNGLVDLSLLPLSNIDRIEVLHGGSSALYGADALGGVVNILTRQPEGGAHVRTEAASGSFGFEQYRLEGETAIGSVGILAGGTIERARNDYPYQETSGAGNETTLVRENSDFSQRQLYVNGTVRDGQSLLNLSTQYVVADRGTPSPFSPLARQSDENIDCTVDYAHEVGGTGWEISSSVRYGLQDYADPNPLFPYQTFYKTMYAGVNPTMRVTLSDHDLVVLGGELSQGTLESPDFDTRVVRVQKALYASHQSEFEYSRPLFSRLVLYEMIRYDRISDVDVALTPKVGINVAFSQVGDIRLRASIGQSFRAPSFNDLYFRGFSNPDLKPERSTSFDAGFTSAFSFIGEHSLEYTYFHQDIDNRIVFDLTTFTPMNIGKVLSAGSEVKYDGIFLERKLNLGVRYTFTDARKKNIDVPGDPSYDRQLVNSPTDVANLSIGYAMPPFSIRMTHTIVGRRYLTSDNTSSLPSYRTTDAGLSVRQTVASWHLIARAQVNNIFDENYEVVKDYPMPKRNFRFTIGIEY